MTVWSLLLGAGARRERLDGKEFEPATLVTLDKSPLHKPDVTMDLEFLQVTDSWKVKEDSYHLLPLLLDKAFSGRTRGLPFRDDAFDEIHAYEVLEHLGPQGDAELFFRQFSEFWRVLKPGGLFFATVPDYLDLWAWGDPSHSRIINQGTLTFLHQPAYTNQVGKSPMSDYRHIYRGDFDPIHERVRSGQFEFILRAVKPSRCSL